MAPVNPQLGWSQGLAQVPGAVAGALLRGAAKLPAPSIRQAEPKAAEPPPVSRRAARSFKRNCVALTT